ncbi:T9SS type A sorting domain-containing protein [Lewinella sp. LCG006]|uniref:T9SS type A sorting domain-containing protein n=1 Tax=Lewinella sp. LCG006 TaxID=3231911 RepID=UPI00345FCB40
MSWKFTLYTFVLFTLSAWQVAGQSCGEFFYDSGGPNGQYQNNEDQTWTFCPDNPGDLVTLNFTAVAVETCCDDLAVYNGTGTGNPLNTDIQAPESFTSSAADGCLTVTWSSDGSVIFAGWEALVSCAPPPPCPNPTLLAVSDVLGTGATFSWNQVGNVNTWDLEIVPAGTPSTGVPSIADVTDNPFVWMDAETGTSYDVYVRGHCENEGEFTNWVGPLSFTTASGCGDSFFDSGGPNGQYQNNELETYTFCPDTPGDLVTLNFIFVDLETCCDNLVIYSGSGTGGPVLNPDLIAPESFTSLSADGCITVTWDSDGSVIRDGWEAIVSCAPAPPCPNPSFLEVIAATTTGGILGWSQVGNVTVWDIEIVPAGTMPTGMPTVMDVTENPYTWTGGESGTEYDFYVRGHCEEEGEFSNWVGPVSFTTIPGCGDSFFDSGGPNGNYQNNEFETFTFCPDNPGEAIIIDFIAVSLENCCDDLSVFNGIGTDDPINLDVQAPGLFISTDPSGCLTVTFDSDGSVIRPGWEATVTCSPCIPDPIILTPDVSVEFFNASSVNILIDLPGLDTFMIEYDTLGFTPGTGNTLMTDDSLIIINNLAEGTDYEFYLTNLCPDGQATVVLGPYSFSTIYFNDVGITEVIAPTDECGLGSGEPIRVGITNFGQNPQTLFPLNFSINGVPSGVNQPVDGFFTGIVSRDSTEMFEFDLNYDFALPGEYTIQVWTEMMNDGDVANDTFTIVVTRFAPPLFEDFEAGIPAYITTNGILYAPLAHNNPTSVIGRNLFFPGEFIVDLPVLGPVQQTDTLFFDYRYVEWSAGTDPTEDLTGTDLLSVLISADCGETYAIAFLQSGTDHEPSVDFRTVSVPLDVFAGENIQIRIVGTYGSGGADYWLDIDNINLPRCDGLGITSEITDTNPGLDDGAVTVLPVSGIAPFEFLWSTGDTTATITDLPPGDYTVTITDRFGCSDQLTVTIDVIIGTEELVDLIGDITLAPNPTQGQSNVRAEFNQSVDARIDVVNLLGQQIWQSPLLERVDTINQTVDLSQVPAGIYLVRIQAAGQTKTIKLVKS